jgi:outer membrane protein OmpA-like peptidoglycan-associated protein
MVRGCSTMVFFFDTGLCRSVAWHLLRCGLVISLVASLAGCSWSWPWSWYHRAPDPEPETVQYSYAALTQRTAHDQITILPKEDGSIGGVVVRQDGIEVLLDKPYATALIQGPGLVSKSTYDAELARKDFETVLSALPERPAHFLLFFLEDSDEMTPESDEEVGRIFAEVSTRPAPDVLVIGHTDAVGTGQHNDKLSLQRAERVRAELIRLGMPEDSIDVEGRGKREPLVNTPDGVAEPRNRRVEIEVR